MQAELEHMKEELKGKDCLVRATGCRVVVPQNIRFSIFSTPWASLVLSLISKYTYVFFTILFIYFLERGEGREKERERNINVWLPLTYPLLGTWPTTQACTLDWESNWQPFGSQAGIQPTQPHQPGLYLYF